MKLQVSLTGLLLLMVTIAFEFQSVFWLNIGISLTFAALLFGGTSLYTLWPKRNSLSGFDLVLLKTCYSATIFGIFNSVLLIGVFLLADITKLYAA